MPRDIYAQGQASIRYFISALVGAGLVFGAVTLLLLEKSVLSRLSLLSTSIRSIGAEGNLSARILMTGEDELASLADTINGMLAGLEQSAAKSKLLANISHDLRTPLNAILGYTEMLQEGVYGPLSNQQQIATREIISSTDQLLEFINNLLSQAQIEAGKIRLNITSFTPAELIDNTKSMLGELAQIKGLKLSGEVAANIPITLFGDPYWLRQILINLVSNALKFTEQGTVHVRIFRPNATQWALQVSDTGYGIPIEAQAYIFDAFRQVNNSVNQERAGVGLGLAIVKQLATLMSGQIIVDSEVGRGSTFTILLPLEPIQEEVA